MRALRLIPAALLLLTSVSAHAALKLNYERKKVGEAGPPGAGTITVDAEHMRFEGMGGGGREGRATGGMIIDAPGKRMLIINSEKKTYHEITEADAKQMKERGAAMKAQMAERVKDMPPEQRKKMEEMMARGMGGKLEAKYEPLGTKKKISGFACEMYRVTIGPATSESCISPWSANVITKAELAQFKKLSEEVAKTFDFGGANMMAEWNKAPGIPIEQTHLGGADGKTPEWTATLKSVTRGDVPASEFQPPAGFTKEAMPMFGGGPGGRGPGGRRGPGGPPPSP